MKKRQRTTHDPVCGQRVNRNRAHIMITYEGIDYPLCCPLCQSEFEKHPGKYIAKMKKR